MEQYTFPSFSARWRGLFGVSVKSYGSDDLEGVGLYHPKHVGGIHGDIHLAVAYDCLLQFFSELEVVGVVEGVLIGRCGGVNRKVIGCDGGSDFASHVACVKDVETAGGLLGASVVGLVVVAAGDQSHSHDCRHQQ